MSVLPSSPAFQFVCDQVYDLRFYSPHVALDNIDIQGTWRMSGVVVLSLETGTIFNRKNMSDAGTSGTFGGAKNLISH